MWKFSLYTKDGTAPLLTVPTALDADHMETLNRLRWEHGRRERDRVRGEVWRAGDGAIAWHSEDLDRVTYRVLESCSWCERSVDATSRTCPGCGHFAHRPRVECGCAACMRERQVVGVAGELTHAEAINLGHRFALFIPDDAKRHDERGFIPHVMVEGVAGFAPMSGRDGSQLPWVWGPTLADAQATCDDYNRRRGVTADDVREIKTSSIAAQIRETRGRRARR